MITNDSFEVTIQEFLYMYLSAAHAITQIYKHFLPAEAKAHICIIQPIYPDQEYYIFKSGQVTIWGLLLLKSNQLFVNVSLLIYDTLAET